MRKRKKTELPLNRRNLPIPRNENPALFQYNDNSDSTAGSHAFMRLLDRLGTSYESIKPSSKEFERTPDFLIRLGAVEVIAEVSDIEPGDFDMMIEDSVCNPSRMKSQSPNNTQPTSTTRKLIKKFKEKRGQLTCEQFQGMPAVLVLFNGCAFPYLAHFLVKPALFGNPRCEEILNHGRQVSSRNIYNFDRADGESTESQGLFCDLRQEDFSAVACLDNGLDAEGSISFMGPVSLRIYHNPLCKHPLSKDMLSGHPSVCNFWFDGSTKQIETDHQDENSLFFNTF